jgi:hypothetical protein
VGYVRKTFTILLAILFLYNTVGFLAVYSFLSKHYKDRGIREVEEFADENEIQILVFDKSDIQNRNVDFRWIESREFKYNGDLYDIVKKEENENQIILYCISDKKETKLEKDFEREIDNSTTNKKLNSGDKNIFNFFNYEVISEIDPNLSELKKLSYGCNYIKNYMPIFTEIPSPPPKGS